MKNFLKKNGVKTLTPKQQKQIIGKGIKPACYIIIECPPGQICVKTQCVSVHLEF